MAITIPASIIMWTAYLIPLVGIVLLRKSIYKHRVKILAWSMPLAMAALVGYSIIDHSNTYQQKMELLPAEWKSIVLKCQNSKNRKLCEVYFENMCGGKLPMLPIDQYEFVYECINPRINGDPNNYMSQFLDAGRGETRK